MRVLALLLTLTGILYGDAREEALALANQAGQLVQSDPAHASQLAEEAFSVLAASDQPAPEDLAACASLAARTARLAGNHPRAQLWFQKALPLSLPPDNAIVRAEMADMLMRDGELAKARKHLGPVPQLTSPSHALAQWQQSSAKLYLACGLPAKAKEAIEAAIAALPPDDTANQVALAIDAAGIALRLDLDVRPLIETARHKLQTLPEPNPELISALTAIAAQAPGLDDQQALTLLQTVDPDSLPAEAKLTYAITMAEAAARAGHPKLTATILDPVLKSDLLPDDHPLLARALALAADASHNPALALKSSEVALRWLSHSDDSDILLGLQRTVDPLTPLIHHSPKDLPHAALVAQNFALRQRLGGEVAKPIRQTVLYLIYEVDFEQHYGALVFNPDPIWVPLGAAAPIHTRIINTVETAERTLGEVEVGARLSVRLTQLWKSLWQPLEGHLDSSLPIDIAPVGMLHAVPWATLRQRDGQFLCQIFDEARILALTGRFQKQTAGHNVLACGTSSAPGSLTPQGEFPFDDHLAELVSQLTALPGVQNELAIFTSPTLVNPSRQEFLESMSPAPGTLHLAGHGFVIESAEGNGFRAGLIFHGGGAENILFARDIAKLDLSGTELVVLSACRGGIGQSEVSGNWSSLRRSFIAAGARQVMAAQWQVRDDQIPGFMRRFYQLRQTDPAPLALWKLQQEWIQKGTDLDLASAGAWVLEGLPQEPH
ncbi:CHAT domain-containing protein [Verrucomicrobiaceae bacterium 227]